MKTPRTLSPFILLGAFSFAFAAEAVQLDCFLEYLGSTGTQYIDTGYIFKTKARVETRAMLMTSSDKDVAGTAGGNVAGCLIIDYAGSSFWYRYGSTTAKNGTSSVTLPNHWVAYVWSDTLLHDGVVQATQTSYNFAVNTSSFWLFASGRSKSSIRFQNVKIYDGDLLVRDFYPAKSGGVAGMYDALNDVFHTNAGTGAFEEGPSYLAEATVSGSPAEFGTVSPSYGNARITNSPTLFSLSGARVFGDAVTAYPSADGLGRALFQRLSLSCDGGEPVVASVPEYAFAVPTNTRILTAVWHFSNRECVLAVDTRGDGEISVGTAGTWSAAATNWFAVGAAVQLKARPSGGHAFLRWEGAGTAVLSPYTLPAPEISVSLDEGCPLTAVFVPVLHVATNGSDSAAGTAVEPMQTLPAAVARAVQTPNAKILLHPGTYSISTTLVVAAGVTIAPAEGRGTVKIATSVGSKQGNLAFDLKDEGTALYDLEIENQGAVGSQNDTNGAKLPTGTRIEGCMFRNFQGYRYGVIRITGGSLVDCVLTNNNAGSSGPSGGAQGGGVWMSAGLIDRCRICDNTTGTGGHASYGGGGVYMTGGTLRNSLIAGNKTAAAGSGVMILGGTIENCTIAGNSYSTDAYPPPTLAGLCVKKSAQVNVVNTIVTGNTYRYGANDVYTETGANVAYSHVCASPRLAGDGNTESDPQFAAAAAGDYRIRYGACVDAAQELPWHQSGLDLAGTNRVVGAAADIGCYEFTYRNLAASFDILSPRGIEPLACSVKAYVGGDTEGLGYLWYFTGDPEPDVAGTDKATVSWTYAAGMHGVRLVVTNAAGEQAECVKAASVYAAPPVVYASADNPNAAFPYATPATAAAILKDANAACVPGCELRVMPGTYTCAGILLLQGVRCRSKDGPESAIVTAPSTTKSLLTIIELLGAGTSLEGLTFQGLACPLTINAGCMMTNCIVRNAVCESKAVVRLSGGSLVDCVVTNNNANSGGGSSNGSYGGGINMSSGLIDRCRICNNSTGLGGHSSIGGGGVYMTGGTLRNALIARNKASRVGSGVMILGGVIENCTIADNTYSTTLWSQEFLSGLYVKKPSSGSPQVKVVNTIVSGNTSMNGLYNVGADGGVNAAYSYVCTIPRLTGTENIDSDPQFRNPAAGDYTLRQGSRCIGAGSDADYTGNLSADLDCAGNPRRHGRHVDLGAFECSRYGGYLLVR